MKVKELIKALRAVDDPEKEILMSSDAEGNNFHGVQEVAYSDEENTRLVIWPDDNYIDEL